MSLCSVKKLWARSWRILVPTVILFTLAACGGEATSTPIVPGAETGTPITDTSPTQLPANGTALTPVAAPTPTTAATEVRITPDPTPSPTVTEPPKDATLAPGTPAPLELVLLIPQDGAGVETGTLRVLGQTRVDAVVGINGVPVEVSADGTFTQDISLEEGINLVEVTATDLTGQTATAQAAVFLFPPLPACPLRCFILPTVWRSLLRLFSSPGEPGRMRWWG